MGKMYDKIKNKTAKDKTIDLDLVILNAVEMLASEAINSGIRLNDKMIFADEDTKWYQILAEKMINEGVKINSVWSAQSLHDKMVKQKFGIDLASFNGDLSLMVDYDPLSQELGKLPARIAVEVAILNGVHGYYCFNGHHPNFNLVNLA